MNTDIDLRVAAVLNLQAASLERYVRSLVRDPDEAADVCQETQVRFLVAARAAGLPDAPGAWMKRVAYNLVVSAARRRQTAVRSAEAIARPEALAPLEDLVVERERDAHLRRVLATTRPDDRVAMVMAATGFGTKDIAARLGRSELATRTLICRARSRMRDVLVAADAS